MNLFWSTRALTAAREDHLTEFFAAALTVSEQFRKAYAELVLHNFVEKSSTGSLQIKDIRTQVCFSGTSSCPDMILTLSDGRSIVCEHKLDAPETMGSERDPRGQLRKYLDLPVDGLLYVRTSWKPPDSFVLTHKKYIRPVDREHFLWRDFYPLLSCDDHVILDWLREGFERLGFTPPHPSVGEMNGPDEKVNRSNRENFAKLWQRSRSIAHTLGWKVSAGSIVELYLTDNPSSHVSWIFISPAKFDRFLFRVTPQPGELEPIMEKLQRTSGLLNMRTEVVQHAVNRKEGKEEVVDVMTPLREILGTERISAEQIEAKLSFFVEPLLRAVSR